MAAQGKTHLHLPKSGLWTFPSPSNPSPGDTAGLNAQLHSGTKTFIMPGVYNSYRPDVQQIKPTGSGVVKI